MSRLYKYFIIFYGVNIIANTISGQDLHFSQYMHSPLFINAANTGFLPNGDYRVGINYRNQWSSIMGVPYTTMSAWGDVQLLADEARSGWLGIGGLLLKDNAGSGNLTSIKGAVSIAYHKMLNQGSLLSVGLSPGFAYKNISSTNLKFPDQFDGHFFDSHLPTSVALVKPSITYFDMQAGINYAYFPNENIYFNAGFSVLHINKPRESFFNPQPGVDNKIPRRYNAFLNGSFKLNNQWIINPNVYFSTQAKAIEATLGANAKYNLSGNGDNTLTAGLYYRYKDALVPMVGVGYKNYQFTFSYDVTVSSLSTYNHTRGAFEFSLVKEGIIEKYKGNKKESMCPHF